MRGGALGHGNGGVRTDFAVGVGALRLGFELRVLGPAAGAWAVAGGIVKAAASGIDGVSSTQRASGGDNFISKEIL